MSMIHNRMGDLMEAAIAVWSEDGKWYAQRRGNVLEAWLPKRPNIWLAQGHDHEPSVAMHITGKLLLDSWDYADDGDLVLPDGRRVIALGNDICAVCTSIHNLICGTPNPWSSKPVIYYIEEDGVKHFMMGSSNVGGLLIDGEYQPLYDFKRFADLPLAAQQHFIRQGYKEGEE